MFFDLFELKIAAIDGDPVKDEEAGRIRIDFRSGKIDIKEPAREWREARLEEVQHLTLALKKGYGQEVFEEPNAGYVKITVDGIPIDVQAGRRTVIMLKNLAQVPPDYDIDLVVKDGVERPNRLEPLPDNEGEIEISGGEIFVSHPKDGVSG